MCVPLKAPAGALCSTRAGQGSGMSPGTILSHKQPRDAKKWMKGEISASLTLGELTFKVLKPPIELV